MQILSQPALLVSFEEIHSSKDMAHTLHQLFLNLLRLMPPAYPVLPVLRRISES